MFLGGLNPAETLSIVMGTLGLLVCIVVLTVYFTKKRIKRIRKRKEKFDQEMDVVLFGLSFDEGNNSPVSPTSREMTF